MRPAKQRSEPVVKPSATRDFKMGMVVLIFFITCLHLFEVTYFPETTVISDEILLGVVMLAVIYLWVQELRDRRKLEVVNDELLASQEELKDANMASMKALIVSEEARDPYLTGHSRRVTEYALAMADKMGISDLDKRHIEYAGYLHDIGKIGISDAILHKPGKLDKEEWTIIKKHPEVGVGILSPLKFLPEEKIIIRYHHERFDGGGYPDGLKDKEIPLGSRILCIADSFDAMNSRRSYRPPLSREKIISELEEARGSQFDPKIADIFLGIIKVDDTYFTKKDESS